VKQRPDEPGCRTTQAKSPALEKREVLADHRHAAAVEVAKRRAWRALAQVCAQDPTDMAALLDRDLRDARQRAVVLHHARRIADDEHVRMLREAQLSADAGAAGTIRRHSESLDERRGLNAGRPEHRVALDALPANRYTERVDLLDHDPGANLDSEPVQVARSAA